MNRGWRKLSRCTFPIGFTVSMALGAAFACCHREPASIPCPEPPVLIPYPLPIDEIPAGAEAKRRDQALRASIEILRAEIRRRDLLLEAYRKPKEKH